MLLRDDQALVGGWREVREEFEEGWWVEREEVEADWRLLSDEAGILLGKIENPRYLNTFLKFPIYFFLYLPSFHEVSQIITRLLFSIPM